MSETTTTRLVRLRKTPAPPAPAHSYLFRGSLADAMGGPTLTAIGAGGILGADRYTFSGNSGLQLTGALTSLSNYSIVMGVNLVDWAVVDAAGQYGKLLDFKALNAALDAGLYNHPDYTAAFVQSGGEIVGASDALAPHTTQMIVLTRNAATTLVCVYVGGVLQLAFLDAASEAVFSSNVINMFQDEAADVPPSGFIKYFAVYAGPLTPAEAANL